jgi:uncharacterized protein YwqG
MQFVAQVELPAVKRIHAASVLPSKGHLCFFRSMQWEWSDFVEGETMYELACVIHVDAPADQLVRTEPAYQEYSDDFVSNVTAPYVYQCIALEAEPIATLPSYASAFTPKDKTDVVEKLHEAVHSLYDSEDGTKEHYMLTHLAEGDFVDAMKKDDVLLLQLGSDDDAGFMWGDMGYLYFVSPRKVVESGDFGKVRIYNGVG